MTEQDGAPPASAPPVSAPLITGEYRATEGIGADSSGPRMVRSGGEDLGSPLFAPGEIVGDKYLIDRVLGEGGLGVVVAATHLHLDQKVAIKYLRGGAPKDRTVTDRFLREARLAAQIRSEHVVRVFDVGTLADGTPYMVMEHLEGADLRKVLSEKGRPSLEQAVDWVLQACEALGDAHQQGIVHRDLKPENLFLAQLSSGREVLKILDFGISKLSEKYTSSSRVNVLTQAGDRLGTPLYMSPEQLEGDANVDGRTDMWAMGVVLYELCTGSMPFTGDSLPALCTSVLTKTPVSVTTLRPELPPELDLVILRCVAKARGDRYSNVAELAQELAPFASVAGQERVREILRTAVHTGESVRSPRFSSADLGRASMSGAFGASVAPSSPPTQTRKMARVLVAVAVLGAFAIGLGMHSLGRPDAAPPVAAEHTSGVASPAGVTVTAASIPSASEPPKPAASAAAPPSATLATPAPAVSASHAAPPPAQAAVGGTAPGAPVRPAGSPAGSARAAKPASATPSAADTTGVLDPF